MLRNFAFTLFVISLLVMGQAVTARARIAPRLLIPTGPQPSSLPTLMSSPRATLSPRIYMDRNDRPHADGGCVVQIARAWRMVGKRRRK
jgi:hypothetical protein